MVGAAFAGELFKGTFLEGLPTWLTALSGLFGIIVLVGTALAVLWSTAAKTRTQVLEDTNKTLMERVQFLEDEGERKDREHQQERALDQKEYEKQREIDQAEKDALKQKVAVLERVVTGRELLEHIQATMDAHGSQVDAFVLGHSKDMQSIGARLESIQRALTANRRLLNAISTKVVTIDDGK